MRVWGLVVGALGLTCSPGSAWPAQPAPASWSGFYAGIGAGWATADSDWNNIATNPASFGDSVPPLTAPFSERISGAVAGLQLGYNVQSGHTVAGIELLANGSWIDGEEQYQNPFGASDDVFELKIRALLAATGRVGYAWDSNLIYVKAGVAAVLVKASVSDTVGPTTGSGRDERWRIGPTVGVGFEYAMTPTVSVALEYNYVHLSEANYQLGDSTGTYLWRIDMPDVHWVGLRLNYRFH